MHQSAYPSDGLNISYARGLRVFTTDGAEYLDACAGTFNVGLGYGNESVVSAIRKVLESGLMHGSSSLQGPSIGDAEAMLGSIAPPDLNRVHMKGCTGGSTAVEQALRHAWVATGRSRIVNLQGGHHGQTVIASVVSGMEFRKNRLRHVTVPTSTVPAPDCYRCPFGKREETCNVECADEVLRVTNSSKDKAAAFLAEPVMGAGGGVVPPRRFWHKVSEGLEASGVPLILDEVQTFGRLNGFLGADYYGIRPTMVVLAKSISGIGLPGAGALLLPERMCLLDQGERALTWGGSNVVGAAIAETIRAMKTDGFFESVQHVGEILADGLEKIMMESRFGGCVRSAGLMSGLELVRSRESRAPFPELASALVDECRSERLLVRQSEYGRGAFVKIRPALTATTEDAREILRRLKAALHRCEERV